MTLLQVAWYAHQRNMLRNRTKRGSKHQRGERGHPHAFTRLPPGKPTALPHRKRMCCCCSTNKLVYRYNGISVPVYWYTQHQYTGISELPILPFTWNYILYKNSTVALSFSIIAARRHFGKKAEGAPSQLIKEKTSGAKEEKLQYIYITFIYIGKFWPG